MAVTEADDRDPGDEVEVALPVVGDQPGALPVDERHGEAGVGGQEWGAGEERSQSTVSRSGAGQAGASVWYRVH